MSGLDAMSPLSPPPDAKDDELAAETVPSTFRIRAYPLAILVTLALAVVAGTIVARNAAPAGDFGGDYPAFYGAGDIAASGDWDSLYSLDRQIEAQRGLHPRSEGDVARYFAYPPQVAFLYQPLAGLDYYWSYLAHVLIMAGALWGAIVVAQPMIPWLRGRGLLAMAVALLFWPMFRTITGGSNTAFTLFVLAAVWRLVHDEHPASAGLVLAILLYKPQFAVPMIGLFLLRRHWRVLQGATLGAALFYLSGVLLRGWGWIGEWLDVASEFGRIDAEVNGHSSISFIGFAENLFGVGSSWPVVLAWVLAGLTAVLLAVLWSRDRQADLAGLMAITMPGILLLSLHAMSHDGAVVVLSAAIAAAVWPRQRWLPWVASIWLLGASQAFIRQLGFSPGFPMLLLVLAMGWLLVADRSAGADLVRS